MNCGRKGVKCWCFPGSHIPTGADWLTFPYCTIKCVKSPAISFVRWEKFADWITAEKPPRVISHLIILPFIPVLCQNRSISPHLFHPVCALCVSYRKGESIQTYCRCWWKRIAFTLLGLRSCVIFSSRSVCGRLIWMQLTSQKKPTL